MELCPFKYHIGRKISKLFLNSDGNSYTVLIGFGHMQIGLEEGTKFISAKFLYAFDVENLFTALLQIK